MKLLQIPPFRLRGCGEQEFRAGKVQVEFVGTHVGSLIVKNGDEGIEREKNESKPIARVGVNYNPWWVGGVALPTFGGTP